MTDHGTFDGPMPVSAVTQFMSLPCSYNDHHDCDTPACMCPCHEAVDAA